MQKKTLIKLSKLAVPYTSKGRFNKAIIDKTSLDIISGSVVDFKKEMIGENFVITNPKATASCGCGLSFSI